MTVEAETAGQLNPRTGGDVDFAKGAQILVQAEGEKVHRFHKHGKRMAD